MNRENLKVGEVVTVGPRYVMGGTFEADEYTGRNLRVVAIEGFDAVLAPADIRNPDESDAEVIIRCTRLAPVPNRR